MSAPGGTKGEKDRIRARLVVAAALCACAVLVHADDPNADPAESLRAKYDSLQSSLGNNQFQRPVYLDSRESRVAVAGEIYALIAHPFENVAEALEDPGNWCDILILHPNTKYCRASPAGEETVLNLHIGKKYDQPLEKAYRVDFAYRVAEHVTDYLQVELNADEGPLSTHDYHIVLRAIPLEGERTFIHLSYSYAYGLVGRLAMQVYLATIGSGKVGFTVSGKRSDGELIYVRGMRGVVERNTMRYYLAIEAFLGAASSQPDVQLERRLRDWFAAAEQYPLQLHEMEQQAYLEMKRREALRQQGELPSPGAM